MTSRGMVQGQSAIDYVSGGKTDNTVRTYTGPQLSEEEKEEIKGYLAMFE